MIFEICNKHLLNKILTIPYKNKSHDKEGKGMGKICHVRDFKI